METNEPVIAISWSGSNGNGKVDIYNYVQANTGGDVMVGDGADMPGSLLLRNNKRQRSSLLFVLTSTNFISPNQTCLNSLPYSRLLRNPLQIFLWNHCLHILQRWRATQNWNQIPGQPGWLSMLVCL